MLIQNEAQGAGPRPSELDDSWFRWSNKPRPKPPALAVHADDDRTGEPEPRLDDPIADGWFR